MWKEALKSCSPPPSFTSIITNNKTQFAVCLVGVGMAYLGFFLSSSKSPITHTRKLLLGTVEMDLVIGRKAYIEELKKEEGLILSDDQDFVTSLSNNFEKIVTDGLRNLLFYDKNNLGRELLKLSDAVKKLRWSLVVVNKEEDDAKSYSCGAVLLYTGLMTKFNLNTTEVVPTLCHEVAHVLARHHRHKYDRDMPYGIVATWQLVESIADVISSGDMFGVFSALGVMVAKQMLCGVCNELYGLYCDRKHEYEADVIGIFLLAACGFDPRLRIDQLAKYAKCESNDGIWEEIWRTHPYSINRLHHVEQYLVEATELYLNIVSAEARGDVVLCSGVISKDKD